MSTRIGNWESRVVRLSTVDGPVTVGIIEASWCPGLGIHRTIGSYGELVDTAWTISHLASGSACVKLIESLSAAMEDLRDLASVCDWTLSSAEINALPHRDEIAMVCNRCIARHTDVYRMAVGPVSAEALRGVA